MIEHKLYLTVAETSDDTYYVLGESMTTGPDTFNRATPGNLGGFRYIKKPILGITLPADIGQCFYPHREYPAMVISPHTMKADKLARGVGGENTLANNLLLSLTVMLIKQ